MSSIWLRIGSYPATEIAAHTPPTWETWADGGSGSCSWAFSLTMRSQHQALQTGAVVEVMCGPMPVWSGILSEPDRTTWECTAYGLASAARQYLALDGVGNNTRDMGTAITTAQAAGWQGLNSVSVSGPVAGDATGNPISAGQLLDEYAEQTGQRWGVDGQRQLYMTPGPSGPMWLASPDASAFGSTDEDRAGTLKGRYLDSGTNLYATATSGSGAPQVAVDLSERGKMTLTAAQSILAGMLTRDHAQRAWTNGVTLTRDQIQTLGGSPAALIDVRAGQMMRSFGLAYTGGSALHLDTVIGKTRYTAGDDTIYVEPVNTAPRSFVDVIAAS
ncbi:hypothetical protein [uncultured Arthrobacter sp.]|uniref:hypothetical protein n=1 Tax=uncultured Arthrobacter sp. TaxID=114050 RepID=UPI0025DC7B13|nr:hypothetical protein [uncultured Arthrobacter sp.]